MKLKNQYQQIPELQKFEDLFNLNKHVAIIIGGAGKMGQQFALTLAYAGATVVLADLDGEKCRTLAKEVAEISGSKVSGYRCDVTKEKDIKTLMQRIYKKFGSIDVLIHNVMAKPEGYYRPVEEYDLKTWRKVMDGNLTGAFSGCREAAKYMKRSGGGSIVLTASIYGVVAPDQRIYAGCTVGGNIYGEQHPLNCPGAYVASKAGIIGLAKYFAALYGDQAIRVNVLVPGGVFDGQDSSFVKEYSRRTPLNRMGAWSDFNGAILFLAGNASRYMTGGMLVIDGGWTVY